MPNSNTRFILNERLQIVDTTGLVPITSECGCESCQQLTLKQRSDESRLQRRILEVRLAVFTDSLKFLNEAQASGLRQIVYSTVVTPGLDLLICRDPALSSANDKSEVGVAAA